jgi:hypothetical protein
MVLKRKNMSGLANLNFFPIRLQTGDGFHYQRITEHKQLFKRKEKKRARVSQTGEATDVYYNQAN